MKSLKEHILEGILDIEDNINIDMTEDAVECFLKNNYKILSSYTIKITKDGFIVDVKGSLMVKNKDITSLTNGAFEFGSVGGDFFCSYCTKLTSLEGAPQKVGGHFCCNDCKSLTTLKGAPKEVGEEFNCYYCDSITSLEGAPERVGGNFKCEKCKSLKTLKGAPKEVGGSFYCDSQFTKNDVIKYSKVTKNIYV